MRQVLGANSFSIFLLAVSEQPCRVAIGGVAPLILTLIKEVVLPHKR